MKILIASGGSDYSFMAVKKACEMVISPESCEIRIVSVYMDIESIVAEPLDLSLEQLEGIENIERRKTNETALRAESIIRNHFPDKELKISMKSLKGEAKREIVNEAKKWKADLIVVGSLGHSALSRFFLGSVSDAVVKNAHCSVLVVRGELDGDN